MRAAGSTRRASASSPCPSASFGPFAAQAARSDTLSSGRPFSTSHLATRSATARWPGVSADMGSELSAAGGPMERGDRRAAQGRFSLESGAARRHEAPAGTPACASGRTAGAHTRAVVRAGSRRLTDVAGAVVAPAIVPAVRRRLRSHAHAVEVAGTILPASVPVLVDAADAVTAHGTVVAAGLAP